MPRLGELFISNTMDHALLSTLGIVVSIYALHVEMKKARDSEYRAMCDISENMSCSRVLTSKYGKGFGFVGYLVGENHFLNMPNCILGIIFYAIQLTLGFCPAPWSITILFCISIVSCIGSLYLATILAFVLRDCCIVCITTYIINGSLMYLNWERYMKMDLIDFV